VAGELSDGGGAGGLLEAGEGVVDGGVSLLDFALIETAEKGGLEGGEFLRGGWSFAEVAAEVFGGAVPDVCEGGFAVGEELGVGGEEGQRAAGVEDDADELGEVDGVDLLVAGVDAEEDGGGSVLEGVGGVVGVGEVVAGEGEDELGVGGGEDALVAMDGGGVAGVPEGFDEGGEGGMRVALEVEHRSASFETTSEWDEKPSRMKRL